MNKTLSAPKCVQSKLHRQRLQGLDLAARWYKVGGMLIIATELNPKS
jgi:hypothetical protein